jgi:hypothetical protein
MMGQTIEQRGRHLGVAKNARHSPKARFVVTITDVCS